MIYRRLILSCSVVQNCQVGICQTVDGATIGVIICQRSVQICFAQIGFYHLRSTVKCMFCDVHQLCSFTQKEPTVFLIGVAWNINITSEYRHRNVHQFVAETIS